MRIPPGRSRARGRRQGFTLIELVLVCAVLGILLASSLPRFQQTAERLRLERSAFELTQLLRYARERAIAQGIDVIWRWDEANHRARVEGDPVAGMGQPAAEAPDGGGRIAESAPLPEGISVALTRDQAAVSCQCLRFFPDGTAETTTVRVSVQQLAYTAQVNGSTGQVVLAAGTAPR